MAFKVLKLNKHFWKVWVQPPIVRRTGGFLKKRMTTIYVDSRKRVAGLDSDFEPASAERRLARRLQDPPGRQTGAATSTEGAYTGPRLDHQQPERCLRRQQAHSERPGAARAISRRGGLPRRAARLFRQALQRGPHAGPKLRLRRAADLRIRPDDGAQRGSPATSRGCSGGFAPVTTCSRSAPENWRGAGLQQLVGRAQAGAGGAAPGRREPADGGRAPPGTPAALRAGRAWNGRRTKLRNGKEMKTLRAHGFNQRPRFEQVVGHKPLLPGRFCTVQQGSQPSAPAAHAPASNSQGRHGRGRAPCAEVPRRNPLC